MDVVGRFRCSLMKWESDVEKSKCSVSWFESSGAVSEDEVGPSELDGWE